MSGAGVVIMAEDIQSDLVVASVERQYGVVEIDDIGLLLNGKPKENVVFLKKSLQFLAFTALRILSSCSVNSKTNV